MVFILFNSIIAGEYKVPLQQFEKCNNIDVFSYPNQMLLKHSYSKFYKLPKNPVLIVSRNQWDSRDVADPYVVVTDNDILMFYDGDNDDRYKIGFARLTDDGWFWEKKEMVLKPSENQWESYHVIDPVVAVLNNKWFMWYSGNKDDLPFGYSLGLATSHNGSDWNRIQKQPVLNSSSESWDFNGVAYADVNYDYFQEIFKMWYSGFFGPFASIGYAESKDGISWKKPLNKPVYAVAPGIIAPDVVFNGEKYMMYYSQLNLQRGMQTHIALAESKDGLEWKFVENVLFAEARWEGNKLMSPAIVFIDQKVKLYYCAQSGSRWAIGEAYAIPKFVSKGNWVSEKITGNYSQVSMVYEQPAGTELNPTIKSKNTFQPVDLISSEKLAYHRKRVRYLIPKTENNKIQISIEMISNKPENSPVIYSLNLLR